MFCIVFSRSVLKIMVLKNYDTQHVSRNKSGVNHFYSSSIKRQPRSFTPKKLVMTSGMMWCDLLERVGEGKIKFFNNNFTSFTLHFHLEYKIRFLILFDSFFFYAYRINFDYAMFYKPFYSIYKIILGYLAICPPSCVIF